MKKLTYKDCLSGNVPMPDTKGEKFAFQILMLLFMSSTMVTFSLILHHGLEFPHYITSMLYMYPTMFCLALSLRVSFVNRLTDKVINSVINEHFKGVARSALISALNVFIMASILSVFALVLIQGFGSITLGYYLFTLLIRYLVAFLVNFLVAGPLTKVIYHGVMKPLFFSRGLA
jgi:hypothetical protein